MIFPICLVQHTVIVCLEPDADSLLLHFSLFLCSFLLFRLGRRTFLHAFVPLFLSLDGREIRVRLTAFAASRR